MDLPALPKLKPMLVAGLLNLILVAVLCCPQAPAASLGRERSPEKAPPAPAPSPTGSRLKVAVGQKAPDFVLPRADGGTVRLSQFQGRQNVVISFVPAAWTPVCSEQWPGYNLAQDQFESRKTVVLGISVDNTPTLFAWTESMGGVWFPVASDFWPHGKVSSLYGVLREDGTSERALFVIDKRGIIRYLAVYEIEQLPDLGELLAQLDKLR